MIDRLRLLPLKVSSYLWAVTLSFGWVSIPHAHAVPLFERTVTEEAVAALRPGQSIWDSAAGGEGAVTVQISIANQRLYVYRGDRMIGASTISSGRPGKETPVGDFEILQKRVYHRSNLYSNAPMPFMQRLTWDGIAIHAGHLPGYPASHGCIRLPTAFARKLFDATSLGTRVSVSNSFAGPFVYLAIDNGVYYFIPPYLYPDLATLLMDTDVLGTRTPPPRRREQPADTPHWVVPAWRKPGR